MNLYFRLLLLTLRTRLARTRPSRLGRGTSLWDEARTPFRVAPTDLDPLRHVNNGKYLSLLDLGRYDLLTRSGFWQAASERGWYAVVAAQTITYKRSLTLGQRFVLRTGCSGWTNGRCTWSRRSSAATASSRGRSCRRGSCTGTAVT